MTQIKMTSPTYVQGNPASGGITLFSLTPWTPIAGTTVTADSSSCVSANGVAGMVSTPNSRSVNVAWSASVNHGTTALYYGFADAPAATYAYHIYWYCSVGTATPYNHSTGLGNFAYSINDKFVITGDGTNWKFYQNGSLKATVAYSSVVTPVKVPYVYVNTVGTGFKQCEYRELTGSAIVPATTDISTSVAMRATSMLDGGGNPQTFITIR